MDTFKTETNFVSSFWDEKDLGFQTVSKRIKNALITQQELLNYYSERVLIEKEYSKKLEKLNSVPLGSFETGVLKKSLDKLNFENGEMVKSNNKFVRSINQINYDKLNNFYQIYSKRTKKILSHMNKIVDKKTDISKDLKITKETYRDNCASIKSLGLTIQTTWGKELEKHEKKLAKLQQNLGNSEKNYRLSLDNYSKINEIFKRDWLISLKEIYQLEIERLQTIKVNCFNYCNNVATLCVDNDQSVDLARSFFAKISPPQDLQDFSNKYGTGNKIFNEYKFVDFMKGLDDENDVSFETADFETPEFNHLLARSYSTYSHASQAVSKPPQSPEESVGMFTSPSQRSSPSRKSPTQPPKVQSMITRSPLTKSLQSNQSDGSDIKIMNKQLPPIDLPKPEDTKSSYSYNNQSPDEKTDIFSLKSKFNNSNSSSNYSNPTNYSSNSEKNWSSPRRKEKLNEFQEKINLKSKELPNLQPQMSASATPSKMPAIKDFSIDFIAKALEDLNKGGNGDIDQYRRSVRRLKEDDQYRSKTTSNTPLRYNDSNEIPTRYDTINFKSPKTTLEGSPIRQSRPKSMYESFQMPSDNDKPRRTLLKAPSKSYTDLYSVVNRITPVTKKPYLSKAIARYSYKSQHQGELSFKKNWQIYIIHKQEDSWYLCELGSNCDDQVGTVGLVPGNYVIEGDDLF